MKKQLLLIPLAFLLFLPAVYSQSTHTTPAITSSMFTSATLTSPAFTAPRLNSATLTSPEDYLGYELGMAFTPHHKVVNYLETLANQSQMAVFKKYGETYEGRSLNVLIISSEENIRNLEAIRINNLKKAGLISGVPENDGEIIVWLSYNIHGNESSSTEAAMATAYALLCGKDERVTVWLKNTIVIIDPCLNPDGRERYVNWYRENKSQCMITDPMGAGHLEPWPGGRMNHYLFDLNRDWSWLSQKESQDRIVLYNEWMPQIHVDFHEQGHNNPYYFAPAAQPYHSLITEWQREFQVEIGRNNARYFDGKNWLYFTKERFDLFYPGYGDTYPTFNGAIGMTYEQAGGGIAGLGIKTNTGDTLTLKDRLTHHFTTGLSTIEVASKNADKLEKNFTDFFNDGRKPLHGENNTIVIKNRKGGQKIAKLAVILDKHKIRYGQMSSSRMLKGYDYQNNRSTTVTIDTSDLVIPVRQSKSVLVRVLFEPVSILEDSLTYDITAWSIPYAFGLETYASSQVIDPDKTGYNKETVAAIHTTDRAYAYAFRRNDISDFGLLGGLFEKGINVRTNYTALTNGGEEYPAGSFFVLLGENGNISGSIPGIISELSQKYQVSVRTIKSGYADQGPDLGSSKLRLLKHKLRVGVLFGEDVSPYSVGEIWYLFEQELDYPLLRLNTSHFSRIELSDLDVIIIPQGYYSDLLDEGQIKRLDEWTNNGGRLIVMGSSLRYFANNEYFNLKTYLDEEEKKEVENLKQEEDYLKKFEMDERLNIKDRIRGGIYKTRLDNTHPIGFGYPEYYFTLKTLDNRYAVLDKGWNIATISGARDKVSGFSGSNTQAITYKALIVGMEEKGEGEVVYFVDDPLFRSFWENGKLMFCNAIFMP